MEHTWERRIMHMKFWCRNRKGRDHLEDIGVDRIILEWILKKLGGIVWSRFTWLRVRDQ
jgi:hypothetical protein